jgi:hypothetical protein
MVMATMTTIIIVVIKVLNVVTMGTVPFRDISPTSSVATAQVFVAVLVVTLAIRSTPGCASVVSADHGPFRT